MESPPTTEPGGYLPPFPRKADTSLKLWRDRVKSLGPVAPTNREEMEEGVLGP